MLTFIHNAGTAAAVVAAVSAWWFVLSYARVRWAATEHGKHLMAFTLGMACIFTFVCLRAVSGTGLEPMWLEVVRLLIYTFSAAMLTWRARIEHKDNHP